MGDETFTVTEEHIKLLRRMYVEWQDCETGAPAIDPKRPYGNSYVVGDIAEILGFPKPKEDLGEDLELLKLHKSTMTALQIVLSTGLFEPGVYRKVKRYDKRSWVRIS